MQTRKKRDRSWGDDKRRKERFLKFVFFGAMARDIENNTTEAQTIVNFASRFSAKKIPPQARNAARVFLRFVDGNSKSHYRWMDALEDEVA